MGILLNTAAIFAGGVLGCALRRFIKVSKTMLEVLGIAVMFLSAVHIISNSLIIEGGTVQTNNVIVIVACLIAGTFIGEWAGLEERLKAGEREGMTKTAFLTGTMLFGIGGLQISGAISFVLNGDSSVLAAKCIVDFPLALIFGSALGMGIAYSSLAVGLMQVAIGACAFAARGFFTPDVVSQLNVMGYILLFFSGFNMVFDQTVRVKTNNMLPAMAVVVCYNIISRLTGVGI